MGYWNDPNNTPAQNAAYKKRLDEIAEKQKLVAEATAAAQVKIDEVLTELQNVCETHGVGTYINPTGEYGGGMYYYPINYPINPVDAFDYDAEGLEIAHAPSSWESSDAGGWVSSSSTC